MSEIITKIQKTTLEIPIALKQLIMISENNLKKYREELFADIQLANKQMMDILKLDPNIGWKLDIDELVYVREYPVDESGIEIDQTEIHE